MNEHAMHYIAKLTHNQRFAMDLQRRFLFLFGTVVLGADPETYRRIEKWTLETEGLDDDLEQVSLAGLANIVQQFREVIAVPSDPFEQLRVAVNSLYEKWRADFPSEAQPAGLALIVQVKAGRSSHQSPHLFTHLLMSG
jgi:hypothetical protein